MTSAIDKINISLILIQFVLLGCAHKESLQVSGRSMSGFSQTRNHKTLSGRCIYEEKLDIGWLLKVATDRHIACKVGSKLQGVSVDESDIYLAVKLLDAWELKIKDNVLSLASSRNESSLIEFISTGGYPETIAVDGFNGLYEIGFRIGDTNYVITVDSEFSAKDIAVWE